VLTEHGSSGASSIAPPLSPARTLRSCFIGVFFARIGPGGTADFDNPGMLVIKVAAVQDMVTFTLVCAPAEARPAGIRLIRKER
jgi:hypothetical protein